MKVNTIPSEWMYRNSMRLDSNPYLAGAFEARMMLRRLKAVKEPLQSLTTRIFHAGREGRTWVINPEYGVRFLGSTDILEGDFSGLPLLSKKQIETSPDFLLEEGWTLITRSGTVGRMAYARADMAGLACSEHVMRVAPNTSRVQAGYVYAFLKSKFGVPQVLAGEYGAVVQHIEPEHVTNLQVPRLGRAEEEAHNLIEDASRLRTQYQQQIRQATDLFFESVGLVDITSFEWHQMGHDLGFVASLNGSTSLRALNFNARYRLLFERLSSVSHATLGEVCTDGMLTGGLRFKRFDADPEFGVKLIGQKEVFWLEPEGRWISPSLTPRDVFVPDETILIAAQGTLGENEVFCRAAFITGEDTEHAYSQHFLRVRPGDETDFSGALLFAFLRSEMAFRCLRSMSVGSKQQDHHRDLVRQFPIPLPDDKHRGQIELLVRDAYRARHEASLLERSAIELIEHTIQEEADAR